MVSPSILLFQLATAATNSGFFQYIFLIIEREVFKMIQKVKRLFLIQFFILGEGSVPKKGLCRLTPFHCVATTWKNYLSIEKED